MEIERYNSIFEKYKIQNVLLLSQEDLFFDDRAILKCNWGCTTSRSSDMRCDTKGLSYSERQQTIRSYHRIFLLHNLDSHLLSRACLALEKELFLDGYYFAFAMKFCAYCKQCNLSQGLDCSFPEKVRPCEQMFGIDMYKTARGQDLPIHVLKTKNEIPNRYGLVFID